MYLSKPHLYGVPRIVKFIKSESTLVAARGQGMGAGKGNGEAVFAGDRLSVWEGKTFWRWMTVRVAQPRECT